MFPMPSRKGTPILAQVP